MDMYGSIRLFCQVHRNLSNRFFEMTRALRHRLEQIGETKKKLSIAEERLLQVQILNDEINKQ